MSKKISQIMASIVLGLCAFAEAQYSPVLSDSDFGHPPDEMMTRVLDKMIHLASARRKKHYEELKTPEQITSYQEKTRAFFVEQLGGYPERTPLNAQKVGWGTREGYRYEKIIYESRPGFYVTALLFLPTSDGPYPGILMPCGHSRNGKASETYQKAAILLAMNGFATLVYDPIGQGERFYPFGESGKQLGPTQNHGLLDSGAILTGTNVAMFTIWDGMRGIDYLQTRDDIIHDKIGLTGNSGGGTLTSYIMALDDRVDVAAPSCYLTNFNRLMETIGPQDAEQNIFGQLAFGMDHPDYILMRAPKPTLMCVATQDFFDIDGAWQTYREAKRLYTRMGYAERVDLIETDAKHGFSVELREGMVRWMKRWLLDIDEPVFEPQITILSDADAQCTPTGNVNDLPGAKSGFDLNVERAEMLESARTKLSPDELREKVFALTGAWKNAQLAHGRVERMDAGNSLDDSEQTWYLEAIIGVKNPLRIYRPKNKTTSVLIYVSDQGKDSIPQSIIDENLAEGRAVCAIDLRGYGETKSKGNPSGWKDTVGNDWTDYKRAYLMGRSFVGMRADDISQTIYSMRYFFTNDADIRLHAVGTATVPALHAAVLFPGTFSHVTLEGGIPSWEAVVAEPYAKHVLINTVHGALAAYELPDLVAMLPDGSVTIIDPHVPLFEVR
ncbi:acetylxylan esterase [bacterium AH-315-P07]|nr:acetylxylan esterase [bacterium AH-315-P07]